MDSRRTTAVARIDGESVVGGSRALHAHPSSPTRHLSRAEYVLAGVFGLVGGIFIRFEQCTIGERDSPQEE